MYKILLVDDEKLELEAIAKYIRWEEMGIIVAGTAKNGREALARMEECKPDIVMTDVRMPIMDGLEFARKAKQLDRGVKIVFLSGHDEFQYIKAALNAEAMGYLLKPIDSEELAQLMQRVVRKCEEDRQLAASAEGLKEKLVRSLAAETSPEGRKAWVQRIALLPVPLPAAGAYAVAYAFLEGAAGSAAASVWESAMARFADVHGASFGWTAAEREFAAICHLAGEDGRADLETAWRSVIEDAWSAGYTMTVGLSSPGRYLEELPDRYEEARRANADRFYGGAGTLLLARPNGIRREAGSVEAKAAPAQASGAADRIAQAIARLRGEEADDLLRAFFAPFREARSDRSAVVAAGIQLGAELERRFTALLEEAAADGRESGLDWQRVMHPDTLDGLLGELEGLCGRLLDLVTEKEQDQHMPIVHRVMELIESRYHEALTVEELAESVYLTPNYVRTLFKQKTGETILEFMTRFRIQRASELLRDRSLRIREVAKAVGYENVSYFCSLFQRHRGVTPNEYRKKML
ncbi:response regulator [Cohnella sp. REN36]|uniref:response regulator n=1 Tax=Cohnella sp. REN36 TaxID=2887347 RepID=UPI001D15AAF2|nr:response regulator [Cohnella sp. REN36]MCC3377221.1 response regulator [Cohnella sp. REN36]